MSEVNHLISKDLLVHTRKLPNKLSHPQPQKSDIPVGDVIDACHFVQHFQFY